MEAIRLETTVEKDGLLAVEGLVAGERVEVIVLRMDEELKRKYPLWGTGARYDNPFEPMVADDEEWGDVFSGT